MNELATTTGESHGNIKQLIESSRFKNAVAAALPAHLKPDRFVRVALTALTRTPKLAQCDQSSFFQSLMALSQFGLEPDGRNAHLIPFENRKRGVTECQLIIDYKGLVDLAMRSGKVAYIHADKVCDNDQFEYDRGQIKTHLINFREPRGSAYAYYAICRFKDGTEKCEVMTKDEIDKIRSRSRAGQSGPWVTDFDEMGKKTVFRRLSKWLQLSPEYRDALEADADALEEHRFDVALPAIVRPVIGGVVQQSQPQPPANGAEPEQKPKRGRKAKTEPGGEAPQAIPVSELVESKLAAAGYKPEELVRFAITQNFCETTARTIADIEEKKLEVFLQNWDATLAELEQQRGGAGKSEEEPNPFA